MVARPIAEGEPDWSRERQPEKVLARMIKRELGVSVDPEKLRVFLRSKFTAVSALAHGIHSN